MLNVIYMVLSRPFGVVSSKLIVKADYNIHHGPYGQFVMITALYHTGRGGRGGRTRWSRGVSHQSYYLRVSHALIVTYIVHVIAEVILIHAMEIRTNVIKSIEIANRMGNFH